MPGSISSITAGNTIAAKPRIGWAKALKGRRDKVFLMTKVCTHGRDARPGDADAGTIAATACKPIISICGRSTAFPSTTIPSLFIRPNGAAEALRKAKEQGKVRFVGFTGHKDPEIHLEMLKTGFPFDSVQMPLNAFDHHFRSFRNACSSGAEEARNRGARNEADQWSWRCREERGAERRRGAALRDEPAGSDDDDHGHRQAGGAGPGDQSGAAASNPGGARRCTICASA